MNQQIRELTFSQLRTFINSKKQSEEINIEIDLSLYNKKELKFEGGPEANE